MLITYKPFPENGRTINKYGVYFDGPGATVDVLNEELAKRLLTNPYFVTSTVVDGVEIIHEESNAGNVDDEKPRRKRRTKAEIEAARQIEEAEVIEDGQDQE